MKNTLRPTLVVMMIVLFALSVAAQDQSPAKNGMRIRVPFDFEVGGLSFPAGTYKVQTPLGAPANTDHLAVLTLSNVEAGVYHAVVTTLSQREKKSESKLVFAVSGGKHILSEVWSAGTSVSLKLHASGTQTELAQTESTEAIALLF